MAGPALAEAAAEDERPEDVGWDWVYNEEMVNRERDESWARSEKARRDFETQTKASATIKGHLCTLLEDRQLYALDLLRGSTTNSVLGTSTYGDSNSGPSRTLMIVADKFSRSQDRFAAFGARRAALEQEWKHHRDRIAVELEAADLRSAARQRELLDNQRRRAFNSAQRRSEQQKTLREFQREKERIWEAYYAKHQAARRAESPRSGAGSPSLAAPAAAAAEEGAGADLLRCISKSHGRYAGQLEEWRQFVAENDRRTEAQWRKMLQRSSAADAVPQEKSLWRSSSHPGSGPPPHLPRTTTAESLSPKPNAASVLRSFDRKDGTVSRSPTGYLSEGESMSAGTWYARKMQCELYAEEQDRMAQEKLLRKQRELQAARERSAEVNREKAAKAEESGRLTAEKVDRAAKRRAEQLVNSDADIVRKYAEFDRKMAEEEKRRAEYRNQRVEAKAKLIAEAQAAAQALLQKKEEAGQVAIEHSQKVAATKAQQFNVQHARRLETDKSGDLAKRAARRRHIEQQALAARAEKELAMKEERSQQVIERERKTIFDRERLLRKETRVSGDQAGSESPSPISAGSISPQFRSRQSGIAGSGSFIMLPALTDVGAPPAPPPPAPLKPKAPGPGKLGAGGRPSTASDDGGGSSQDENRHGEAEFLEELGRRSGEWLQELRRKNTMSR